MIESAGMHIYIQLAPFASTMQEEGKARGERGKGGQQRKLGRSPLSCGYILCLINSLLAEHGVRQTLSIFIEFHSLRLNVCRFCQSCHTHTRSLSPPLPICIWRLGGLSLWPCIEACFKWFYRTRLIASCNQFAAASLRIRSVCQIVATQTARVPAQVALAKKKKEKKKRKIYSYFN